MNFKLVGFILSRITILQEVYKVLNRPETLP